MKDKKKRVHFTQEVFYYVDIAGDVKLDIERIKSLKPLWVHEADGDIVKDHEEEV